MYLRPLLDDPVVADDLAFVAFHQYYPSAEVQGVLDFVQSRRPDIPVVVTEYTSFSFGDLDAGQEANAQYGFGLDIVATLLSHYRQGVDAALYWDAVDYLQPGHEAITKWGLLQGPAQDFKRRVRYYSLLQVLPYLQPGARVLDDRQTGDDQLTSLAIRTADGLPALFMVNQDFVPIDLTLTLNGGDVAKYPQFVVTRTARGHLAEVLGRADLQNGEAQLTLPPRSITTLFPPGAEPSTTDDQ
jgi:hypothetical protein